MAWTDPDTAHKPTTGNVIPTSWGTMVNQNLLHLYDDLRVNYFYRSNYATATWSLGNYVKHPIGTGYKQESDGSASWDIAGPTAIGVPVAGNYLLIAFIRHQWNITIEARFMYDGISLGAFGVNGYPTGGGLIATDVTFAITKVLPWAGSSIELEIKPTGNLPAAENMVARVMIARIR